MRAGAVSLFVCAFAASPFTSTSTQAADSFTATGSMPSALRSHAADLLLSGKVLVAGGSNVSPGAGALYDPALGTFSPTGSMSVAPGRMAHTLTRLNTGRALVAGGSDPFNGNLTLSSAQIFDESTNGYAPTGSLISVRRNHTASLLPNGRVLVAGGETSSVVLSSSELYDPATGTFSAGPSLPTARRSHVAAALPGGKVLVAGGFGASAVLASAAIYDPATNTWAPTGSLATARYQAEATPLADGRVLVVGGRGAAPSFAILASAEIYSPVTGTWNPVGSMVAARVEHRLSLLQDGRVLVTGGGDTVTPATPSSELFDVGTGSFTAGPAMITPRILHTATRLVDGRVLVAGGSVAGSALSAAELFVHQDPIPGPVQDLRLSAGGLLDWNAVADASAYDVVQGDLVNLRLTSGDFTSSSSQCLEDNGNDLQASDASLPAGSGSGFFYLVRGVNASAAGTYDSGLPGQAGSRDAEIQASAGACP